MIFAVLVIGAGFCMLWLSSRFSSSCCIMLEAASGQLSVTPNSRLDDAASSPFARVPGPHAASAAMSRPANAHWSKIRIVMLPSYELDFRVVLQPGSRCETAGCGLLNNLVGERQFDSENGFARSAPHVHGAT